MPDPAHPLAYRDCIGDQAQLGSLRMIAPPSAGPSSEWSGSDAWPNPPSDADNRWPTTAQGCKPLHPSWQRESLAAFRPVEEVVPAALGTEGVTLRYGGLYRPGTGNDVKRADRAAPQAPVPDRWGRRGVWSLIHIADPGSATVAALNRGAPGVYNLVDDDPASAAEWIPTCDRRRAPTPGACLAWPHPRGRAACIDMTRYDGHARLLDAKAKRELDWEPRYPSCRERFAAEARDLVLDAQTA